MTNNQSSQELYNAKMKLCNKLKKLHDDKDFVDEVLTALKHIDDVNAVSDFIDDEPEDATPDMVSLYAVDLYRERKGLN